MSLELAVTSYFLSQAFASSLSYSLSTKAVLEGVGVGNVSSTPLAATLMWLIKDGTGMVGRIMFAWCNGYLKRNLKYPQYLTNILP